MSWRMVGRSGSDARDSSEAVSCPYSNSAPVMWRWVVISGVEYRSSHKSRESVNEVTKRRGVTYNEGWHTFPLNFLFFEEDR